MKIEMNQTDILSCRIWLELLQKQKIEKNAVGGVLKMPIPTQRELEALSKLALALANAE
jgi:hypothetical protein